MHSGEELLSKASRLDVHVQDVMESHSFTSSHHILSFKGIFKMFLVKRGIDSYRRNRKAALP